MNEEARIGNEQNAAPIITRRSDRPEGCLSLPEAAKMCDIDPRTVRFWFDSCRLTAVAYEFRGSALRPLVSEEDVWEVYRTRKRMKGGYTNTAERTRIATRRRLAHQKEREQEDQQNTLAVAYNSGEEWSDEKDADFQARRLRGDIYTEIAFATGRSLRSITTRATVTTGKREADNKKSRQNASNHYRRWSPEKDDELQERYSQGQAAQDIASAMGRTYRGINNERMILRNPHKRQPRKTRSPEEIPEGGIRNSEACRRYSLSPNLLSRWIKAGDVEVLKRFHQNEVYVREEHVRARAERRRTNVRNRSEATVPVA